MMLQPNTGQEIVRKALADSEEQKVAQLWPTPDMSVVNQGRRDAPGFPTKILGPFWSEQVTTAAAAASAPIDYVACSLLLTAAALIGNSRWVSPWEGWKEPCALWCGLVGDPSSAKSPGMDYILDVVRSLEADMAVDFDLAHRRWEEDNIIAQAARDEWEKMIKGAAKTNSSRPPMPDAAPMEPVRPRIVVSDTTPEKLGELLAAHPKGLLFHRDELAGWFGSFDRYTAGGERALWIESFGGRKYVIDRVKAKTPIVIPFMTISILGGIQPDRLAEMIKGPDDGLPSRFLWAWPEPIPPRRPTEISNQPAAVAALRRLSSLKLGADDLGAPVPRVLRLDEAAAALFQEWREEHHEGAELLVGPMGSAWGKMRGQLLRLSLVIEHLWFCGLQGSGAPEQVSKGAIECAAALMTDYFAPMAARVYGDASLPPQERGAATLARWILRERPRILNARDVRREARLPGLREADQVTAAIKTLEEANWLRAVPERDGDTSGRRRADYAVNPNLPEVARDQSLATSR
jgi:hypothetical protein